LFFSLEDPPKLTELPQNIRKIERFVVIAYGMTPSQLPVSFLDNNPFQVPELLSGNNLPSSIIQALW
jgi:hypothetical protein